MRLMKEHHHTFQMMHPVMVSQSEEGIQTLFKACHCLVKKEIIQAPWLKQEVDY